MNNWELGDELRTKNFELETSSRSALTLSKNVVTSSAGLSRCIETWFKLLKCGSMVGSNPPSVLDTILNENIARKAEKP